MIHREVFRPACAGTRRILVVLGLAIACCWGTHSSAQTVRSRTSAGAPARARAPGPKAQEDYIAVVNGEPIARSVLLKQCRVRWGKDTLESMFNKQLITEACGQQGIVISRADIDAEIESIARKFGMDADQYLLMLQKERDVSAVNYRRDIVWPALALKRLAADQLTVTKEQLDQEYESEFGSKVQVRMISLTSRAKAQKVLQAVQAAPEQFPQLAKKYSEDPNSASAKGLIPPIRRHMGEPAVEKAVFAMQPGQVSGIVEAANQYLIFRCERILPPATISPQFRRETNKRLSERIVERNLRSVADGIFKELQSKAEIVNVLNNPKLRQQSPGVAAFVNKKPITLKQLDEECLARYGRDMIETEINYRLLTQALKKHNASVSQQELNAEVARAAEAFGYVKRDGSADVDAWIKAVTEKEGIGVKEYLRDAVWPSVALKQLVKGSVRVDEEDLKKGFEANYGERVEVLAIVLGNQRVAQQVWDMARKNSKNAEFFGQLAEQYSVEAVSRANFGEIPPIRRHGGQPQIEAEAFSLKPGELSGIVALGDKFVILKCLGRTTPVVEQMADVREELTKDILEKKMRVAMSAEFDRIRQQAQIDNFLTGTSQAGQTKQVKAPGRGRVPAKSISAGRGQQARRGNQAQGRKVLLTPPGR